MLPWLECFEPWINILDIDYRMPRERGEQLQVYGSWSMPDFASEIKILASTEVEAGEIVLVDYTKRWKYYALLAQQGRKKLVVRVKYVFRMGCVGGCGGEASLCFHIEPIREFRKRGGSLDLFTNRLKRRTTLQKYLCRDVREIQQLIVSQVRRGRRKQAEAILRQEMNICRKRRLH